MHKLKLSEELQKCEQQHQELIMNEIKLINDCENFKEVQSADQKTEDKEETKEEVKMIKM